MTCVITYKNKEYSEKEFKDLLLTDSDLYTKIFTEFKNKLNSVLEKVKQNPEFLQVGTVFKLYEYMNKEGISSTDALVLNDYKKWTLGIVAEETVEKDFSDLDKYTIIQEVISQTFAALDVSQGVDRRDLYAAVEETFDQILNQVLEEGKDAEYEYMDAFRDEILGKQGYEDSILEYIDTELDLDPLDDILSVANENVKEHGQASYEVDMTKSLSTKIKMMFSAIKDPNSEPGFAGFTNNLSGKDALEALQQVMAESNDNSLADIKRIINNKMALNDKDFSFYKEILDILETNEKTNPEILNQVLYNLYQNKVKMRFIMWRQGEDGKMFLENYDANVKNPLFIKRNHWVESLKINGLIDQYESDFYKINNEVMEHVEELYQSLIYQFSKEAVLEIDEKTGEKVRKPLEHVNRQDLKNFLHYFGITLNNKTLDNLFESQLQNDFELRDRLLDGKNSIVSQLMKNLREAKDKVEKGQLLSLKSHPDPTVFNLNLITKNNSQINDLIHADNFIEFLPMGTMYIAGKTINMYQQPNPINNKMANIKRDLELWKAVLEDKSIPEEERINHVPRYLKRFLDTKVTGNSHLVEMMMNNPAEAVKYFDTVLISLEALKENGTKSRDDMGITELSDKDSITTLLGVFASSEGSFQDEAFQEKYLGELKLRKGTINFPTLSDSSQMPLFKTILLELNDQNIDLETGEFSDELLNFLKDQLVKGDLSRIEDFITKTGGYTGVSGYDAGAKWLTNLSFLNTVLVDTGLVEKVNTGNKNPDGTDEVIERPLIRTFKAAFERAVIENNKKQGSDRLSPEVLISNFLEKNQEVIDDAITKGITHEVNKYIDEDGEKGDFIDNDLVNKDGTLIFDDGKGDKGYFGKKPARLVAFDYVINNFVQQKEIQTLFAGDLAYYFKDNMAKDLENGLPKVTFTDIATYYYEENLEDIKKIIGKKSVKDLSEKEKQELFENYPKLAYSYEFTTLDTDYQEQYEAIAPALQYKVNTIFKSVQNNLSKRLKGQLSPGNQYANSKGIEMKDTREIVMKDVEVASETIADMVQRTYPDVWESSYEYKDKTVTFQSQLKKFKALDENRFRDEDQETEYSELKKDLEKRIPTIAAYLKTTSTDAQEYTSWENNLDQLLYQGRINSMDYAKIKSKLTKQAQLLDELDASGQPHIIPPDMRLTPEELKIAVMQPSKPLFSGLVDESKNGHKMERYVYVKSSSFPIVPELAAMFPKLNKLRRTMETIERMENVSVRVTYESAVKVGAPNRKNQISAAEIYQDRTDEEMKRFIDEKIKPSSILLPKEDFYIQQDKPFKSDKNALAGKIDRTVRATQFEKIILGDGITHITEDIFPATGFDKSLLSDLGIVDKDGKAKDNINGKDLQKMYNELYKREQKILSQKLFNELGIDTYKDIEEGKVSVMQNLARLANKRLNNKQDKKVLELLYEVKIEDENGVVRTEYVDKATLIKNKLKATKAIFKMPLMLTPNSRKFESVFNSVINKNSINLQLPGFSFPVASQEGFDFAGVDAPELERLKKQGLILTKNFDPQKGLQSERDSLTGELKHAQVFIANKFKVLDQATGQYKYIDLKKYVDKETNTIDTNKIPQELLELFSFRIPTSRHQSGAVIEIAGFLPHTMGDLMIVPKDHTVQIGEDYDIDVRYAYQQHYIETPFGLKKLTYDDVAKPEKTLEGLKKDLDKAKDDLWNSYYEEVVNINQNKPLAKSGVQVKVKNDFKENNKETFMEIIFLEDAINNFDDKELLEMYKERYEEDIITKEFLESKVKELEAQIIPNNLVKARREELQNEYRTIKKDLQSKFEADEVGIKKAWKKYNNAHFQKGTELKVVENNIVSIYKSVFSSPNPEIRNMITAVLSTDFSEETAAMIDEKISSKDPYFNIFSPHTQRKVMKLGADGKMGIGVHSNAVTMQSLLQQLHEPIQVIKGKDSDGKPITYHLRLGNFVFDGKLGKVKDETGRRISEYLSESQNSSTDNQKLEIMGRRNENSETISVFSLLQMSGMDNDGLLVNGKEVSYASLFISQPVLQKYVELVKSYKSSTVKSFGNPVETAIEDLKKEYIEAINQIAPEVWARDKENRPIPGVFSKAKSEEIGSGLTSERLYETLDKKDTYNTNNVLEQYYVLTTFMSLIEPSKNVRELQSFINIESNGMGISYFDTISLKNFIGKLDSLNFASQEEVASGVENLKGTTSLVFGDKKLVPTGEKVEDPDYIFVYTENGQDYYIKPSNHYSHKIMNSIAAGYNMWNSIFPYDHNQYKMQIDQMLEVAKLAPDSQKGKELQYDIISSMKDYSYISSNTLFGGNLEAERQALFFDDKEAGRESLGGYLLRMKNDPNYSHIFKQPFFRDLQIFIEDKTHPTIIKYVSGDMSKINNLKMYNLLERMSKSDKPLMPRKDGTAYTEKQLMVDLLKYSLIADQGNGAIGFRHLLPLSLFENNLVTDVLRTRNNIQKSYISHLHYNGSLKYAENVFGNPINSEGVIPKPQYLTDKQVRSQIGLINLHHLRQTGEADIFVYDESTQNIIYKGVKRDMNMSNFIRQYFQHNPDKVGTQIKYSPSANSKYSKILTSNGVFSEDLEAGTVQQFVLGQDKSGEPNPLYITITDRFGSVRLYEKVQERPDSQGKKLSYYKEIPKLGIFGYNEYQIGKDVNSSTVSPNNVTSYTKLDGQKPILIDKTVELLNNGNLSDALYEMQTTYDGPYAPLLGVIKEFMPNFNSIDIQVGYAQGGAALYRQAHTKKVTVNGEEQIVYVQPTIIIDEEHLRSGNKNERYLQDLIMEELLHHITRSTIDEYVTITGINSDYTLNVVPVKDGNGIDKPTPPALKSLLQVYSDALRMYSKKHDKGGNTELWDKIQSMIGEAPTLNSELASDAYKVSNIHEFIAAIFIKDKAFANEMANTPYKQSGKSFLTKFAETLMRFFGNLLPNNRRDTVSAAVAHNLIHFLSHHKDLSGKNNRLLDPFEFPGMQVYREAQKVLNDSKIKDGVKPPKIQGDIDLFTHNSNSKYNSEYRKDSKDFKPYRLRFTGADGYGIMYGKDISSKFEHILPGAKFAYAQKDNGSDYIIFEVNSGKVIPIEDEVAGSRLDTAVDYVLEYFEEQGIDRVKEWIPSLPNVYDKLNKADIEKMSPEDKKAILEKYGISLADFVKGEESNSEIDTSDPGEISTESSGPTVSLDFHPITSVPYKC